ncbi:ATP-binding protein [Variovorax sp. PvP013]|uniref:ATP-binding protein n=1 Tax=Variovorax sp. PvP013 TaxID=3156435 RepID=UPI003D1EEE88
MTSATTVPVEAAGHADFPFAALVGQPLLRRALLLAAVDPAIGGVLVGGPRGTAKSTAARALAALLPATPAASPAPFVTLPLSASVEQLVGTLDVEDVLRDGRLRLAPGLLARAHHGVLYVDEVNLLPDALVDAMLDAAASGVNTVERDGISHRHAARFVLVGTMNPEEGELRPQLLDRFGLSVTLANPADAAQRTEILRTRLRFDADPAAFARDHAGEQARLAGAVVAAQALLPRIAWPDAVLQRAAALALAAGVDGLRADLVMLRAARALAALAGRDEVAAGDVDEVAELALAHRRGEGVSAPAPAPAAGPRGTPPPADGDRSGRAGPDGDVSADASPMGDWGALPPVAETLTRVVATQGWPAKKA